MKQAILFMTNHSDASVINRINQLLPVKNADIDFFILYNLSPGENIPKVLSQYGQSVFPYSTDILYEMGYHPLGDSLVMGNCHFPVLKFFLSHSGYEYYWIIEDDVVFTGEWKTLFTHYEDEKADLISAFVKNLKNNPSWPWWRTLVTGREKVGPDEYLGTFNPIYRLSMQALRCLHEALTAGWRGHNEVVIASLLRHRNMTIKDMGGSISFADNELKNGFYSPETHSFAPLQIQDIRPNMIYHPVKQKIGSSRLRNNCVITAVGRNSLHRAWIENTTARSFDLHLIVFDDSFSKYYDDADFMSLKKGFKLRLVYDYLKQHPDFLEHYAYFFIPDDDILTDGKQIEKLFTFMDKHHLQIAQPALKQSYYSYPHTLQEHFSKLRYTNFVEMMLPCFSNKAINQVLETFNASESGWGVEYHWPLLIESNHKDIAIIDELSMIHTRPVKSGRIQNRIEMQEYLKKHHLIPEVLEYGYIPLNSPKSSLEEKTKNHRKRKVLVENMLKVATILEAKLKTGEITRPGLNGILNVCLFLNELSHFSEGIFWGESAKTWAKKAITKYSPLQTEQSFTSGALGITWAINRLMTKTKDKSTYKSILKTVKGQIQNTAMHDETMLGFTWEELIRIPLPTVMSLLSERQVEKEKTEIANLLNIAWRLMSNLYTLYDRNMAKKQ